MNAEIIAIGSELLLGETIDTNSAYLARQLASIGIGLFRKTVVGDNEQRIAAVIGEWMGAAEGLGLVMTRAQRAFRTDRVFAAIVVVALVSLALFALVGVLGRLATPWTTATQSANGERTSERGPARRAKSGPA